MYIFLNHTSTASTKPAKWKLFNLPELMYPSLISQADQSACTLSPWYFQKCATCECIGSYHLFSDCLKQCGESEKICYLKIINTDPLLQGNMCSSICIVMNDYFGLHSIVNLCLLQKCLPMSFWVRCSLSACLVRKTFGVLAYSLWGGKKLLPTCWYPRVFRTVPTSFYPSPPYFTSPSVVYHPHKSSRSSCFRESPRLICRARIPVFLLRQLMRITAWVS